MNRAEHELRAARGIVVWSLVGMVVWSLIAAVVIAGPK